MKFIYNAVKAAIFDLDGTLTDSMGIWEKVDVDFLTSHGIEVPDDYSEKIYHMSFKESATYTIETFGLPYTVEEIWGLWNEMARHEYSENVYLKPYAKEFLESLKARGIKLGIATALTRDLYTPMLKHNGVLDMFSAIVTVDEIGKGKNEPDIYVKTAELLETEPCDCIVFEDILLGIRSAKSAGMKICGVYDRYADAQRGEIVAMSDIYINSFKELL